MKHTRRKKFAALTLVAIWLAMCGISVACDCDEPVIVDGLEAHERSLRSGRDAVEGFWAVYLDWQPEVGAARRLRLAVVKNDYGVYPGTDYIGVSTCDQPGCTRGEVKLLLTRTDDPQKFETVLLVTDTDGAKGTAVLTEDKHTGRPNALLDLSELRYKDRMMTYGLVRVTNG
ncbi:MAG: hypothetical protein LBG12_02990 [Synergistaceae bacterium]|nr:hypothetical protein [Synergistaceae bacterium]